jgi:hypothetical protein
MTTGRTCPKCQSFDVRPVTIQGHDLYAYSCHDCLHVFYISATDLQRERDEQIAGKVERLPKKAKHR